MNTDYFIFGLFLPVIVLLVAAIASNQPETKRKFFKSALFFVCLLVLIIPIRFWRDFMVWLFHQPPGR